MVGVDILPRSSRPRGGSGELGIEFELIEANAEEVPLPGRVASTSLVSEYGASIWCDPYSGSPRRRGCFVPAGELVFLCNSVLVDPLLARQSARSQSG